MFQSMSTASRTLRVTALLAALCWAGCGQPPAHPESYVGHAVTLHAEFAGLPADRQVDYLTLIPVRLSSFPNDQRPPQPLSAKPHSGPTPSSVVIEFPVQARETEIGALLKLYWIVGSDVPKATPTEGLHTIGDWTSLQDVLAYAARPGVFSPLGQGQPTVTLEAGYSVLRRTCDPVAGIRYEVRPVLEPVTLTPTMSLPPVSVPLGSEDAVGVEHRLVTTCGLAPPEGVAGTRVSIDRADALIWPTAEDIVYVTPRDSRSRTALRAVGVTTGITRDIAEDDFGDPLVGGGTLVIWNGRTKEVLHGQKDASGSWTLAPVPVPYGWPLLPSPDGARVAYRVTESGQDRAAVFELGSGQARVLGPGTPVAWSPDARSIVTRQGSYPRMSFGPEPPKPNVALVLRNLDGAEDPLPVPAGLPTRLVWTAAGPAQLVGALPWNLEDLAANSGAPVRLCCLGLGLHDPRTGAARTILDGTQGIALEHQSVTAADTLLVWLRRCYGLGDTYCRYDLHQIRLSDGQAQVIASANTPAPLALSPDGRRVAMANARGIFVLHLP